MRRMVLTEKGEQSLAFRAGKGAALDCAIMLRRRRFFWDFFFRSRHCREEKPDK